MSWHLYLSGYSWDAVARPCMETSASLIWISLLQLRQMCRYYGQPKENWTAYMYGLCKKFARSFPFLCFLCACDWLRSIQFSTLCPAYSTTTYTSYLIRVISTSDKVFLLQCLHTQFHKLMWQVVWIKLILTSYWHLKSSL